MPQHPADSWLSRLWQTAIQMSNMQLLIVIVIVQGGTVAAAAVVHALIPLPTLAAVLVITLDRARRANSANDDVDK